MRSKFFLFFPLLIFFSSQLHIYAQNEDADEIIKVDTTYVSVPVIVSDRNGRYIPNLKKSNFKLFQDGEKQEISFFGNEKEPLNIALLLDTSKSTRNVIDLIKKAAIDFIYLLEKSDKASVITFDAEINVITNLTSNRIQLERAIRSVDIGYDIGTVMRDAVIDAVQNSFKNVKGRKAIIVLTDGKDFGSYYSEDGLLNRLEESDVLVYSVFYKTGLGQRRRWGRGRWGRNFPRRRNTRQDRMNKEAEEYLKYMSEITAGRFYKKNVDDLRKTFKTITSELRNQYRLGYYPTKNGESGTIHKIKVEVDKKKISVRARKTYRAK